MSRIFWCFAVLVVGVAAAAVLGCSGGGGTSDAPAEAVTPEVAESTPFAASRVTPVPTAVATSGSPGAGYDSRENMYRLFSGRDHESADTLEAIELAVANGDKSMVPVLIEMLRFFQDYVHAIEARKALTAITGREVERNEGSWSSWMEWLVNNADEYHPPAGYLDWKIGLMSLIDPRFEEFLAPAAEGSRVNVVEIAWGGVRPDGIPDLQNSPVVSAEEQDYLQPGTGSSGCLSTGSIGRTRIA